MLPAKFPEDIGIISYDLLAPSLQEYDLNLDSEEVKQFLKKFVQDFKEAAKIEPFFVMLSNLEPQEQFSLTKVISSPSDDFKEFVIVPTQSSSYFETSQKFLVEHSHDSFMIADSDILDFQRRLLDTDSHLYYQL